MEAGPKIEPLSTNSVRFLIVLPTMPGKVNMGIEDNFLNGDSLIVRK